MFGGAWGINRIHSVFEIVTSKVGSPGLFGGWVERSKPSETRVRLERSLIVVKKTQIPMRLCSIDGFGVILAPVVASLDPSTSSPVNRWVCKTR